MTLLKEIKHIQHGPKELRSFGLMVGGIFFVLGCLFLWRHKPHALYFITPGVLLLMFGQFRPSALKYAYIPWMAFALIMGAVMSRVILTVLFYTTVTPIGLLARIFGKKFLDLDFRQAASTYWIPKESRGDDRKHCETQF